MAYRKAHGTGAPAGLRTETRPLDEIPPPNAEDTAAAAAMVAQRGRPFQRGNQAAKGRRPALAGLGIPLDAQDPRYRSALRKANVYRRRRCAEVARLYGWLSAGAAGMLGSAALAMAASRYLYQVAAEDGNVSLLPVAAALADKARQAENTAIDLAEKEKASRPTVDPMAALKARMAAIDLPKPEGTPE